MNHPRVYRSLNAQKDSSKSKEFSIRLLLGASILACVVAFTACGSELHQSEGQEVASVSGTLYKSLDSGTPGQMEVSLIGFAKPSIEGFEIDDALTSQFGFRTLSSIELSRRDAHFDLPVIIPADGFGRDVNLSDGEDSVAAKHIQAFFLAHKRSVDIESCLNRYYEERMIRFAQNNFEREIILSDGSLCDEVDAFVDFYGISENGIFSIVESDGLASIERASQCEDMCPPESIDVLYNEGDADNSHTRINLDRISAVSATSLVSALVGQ